MSVVLFLPDKLTSDPERVCGLTVTAVDDSLGNGAAGIPLGQLSTKDWLALYVNGGQGGQDFLE